MVDVRKAFIDDRGGDGGLLQRLPRHLARPVRHFALGLREQRQKRLLRIGRRLSPTLRALEEATMADQPPFLAGRKFGQAYGDDLAIERALMVFHAAREAGLIEFRTGTKQTVIANDDTTTTLGCCGMSIQAGERFFLYRAARLISRNHPQVKFSAKGMLNEPAVLPRLRMLASMEQTAVVMLQRGLGERFKEILYPENQPRFEAVTKLQGFHVRGLMETLGGRNTDIAGWTPEFLLAIAESLSCYEQVRDIGNCFLILKGPAAVRALGRWTIRDVTDKANEDATRRGGSKLTYKVYETDIGTVRNILGHDFGMLMEQPSELLDAVRLLVAYLRTIERKTERSDRVEEFRLFVKRYLPYMHPEILSALKLTDVGNDDEGQTPISFREALGILEGLWTKEGLGRVFFEQILPTPHGIAAMRGLVDDLLTMKKRGSIKPNTDIAAILSGSDLFDSHLVPFLNRKGFAVGL